MTTLTTLPPALEPMVEAMAAAIALLYNYKPYESAWPEGDIRLAWTLFEKDARAALLAGLNAALEQSIAHKAIAWPTKTGVHADTEYIGADDDDDYTALILNIGPKESA